MQCEGIVVADLVTHCDVLKTVRHADRSMMKSCQHKLALSSIVQYMDASDLTSVCSQQEPSRDHDRHSICIQSLPAEGCYQEVLVSKSIKLSPFRVVSSMDLLFPSAHTIYLNDGLTELS